MAEDWARPVVHWEIQANDQAKIRDFYSQMFNWQIGDGPIMGIGPGIGAPEQITGHIMSGHGNAPGVVLYIQVLELRASMEKAERLGGKIVAQPFDIPNGPTIAGITDPEGNRVVLVQQ
jgi:predicted enzyme related to lactoylglutathione lyase